MTPDQLDAAVARSPSPSMSPDEWNRMRHARTEEFGLQIPTWEDQRGRHLMACYSRDLGGDLTTAQRAILQRIVVLQVACEVADIGFIAGKGKPDTIYVANTKLLQSLLKDLKLDGAKGKAGKPAAATGKSSLIKDMIAARKGGDATPAEQGNVVELADWMKPAAGDN